MRREKGILSAEIDIESVRAARRKFDVAGHYARPDVLKLTVNRASQKPAQFEG